MEPKLQLFLVAALLLVVQSSGESQLRVQSMHFRSHIKYRFATTLVTSTVLNKAESGSEEAFFEVILPEEAFISNFTMTVDGVVYPGRVEEKAKAKKEYDTAKIRGQSAGYIKTTSRHSNKFDISVNLKAGSSVTFNLTYQQVLERCHGLYEHKINIKPGHQIPDIKAEVFIEESRVIREVATEFLIGDNNVPSGEEVVTEEIPSPTSRYIAYIPTEEQLEKAGSQGINKQMVIKYDVERTNPGGEMLVIDGHFIHFFAPENAGPVKTVPKDILFILDVSGSMSGDKISQLIEAMTTILEELSSEDTFNIFTFSSGVQMWKPTLVPVDSRHRRDGTRFVQSLHASGSTDINKALVEGVSFLHAHRNISHVPLIFFLTDGEPTVGVKNSGAIAANVQRINEDVASAFGLAFGAGADFELTKVIAVQNNGFARRIYEAADASEQVKGFYDEISTTVLRNLTITYEPLPCIFNTTPTFFRNLFEGKDVVVAGKLTEEYKVEKRIQAEVQAVSGSGLVNLILDNIDDVVLPADDHVNKYFQLPVDFAAVSEKAWAFLTIKSLLKQRKKDLYKKENKDLDEKIVQLALKYKFVTPLTSMIATKPDQTKAQAAIEGDEFKPESSSYQQRGGSSYRTPMGVQAAQYPQPGVQSLSNSYSSKSIGRGYSSVKRLLSPRRIYKHRRQRVFSGAVMHSFGSDDMFAYGGGSAGYQFQLSALPTFLPMSQGPPPMSQGPPPMRTSTVKPPPMRTSTVKPPPMRTSTVKSSKMTSTVNTPTVRTSIVNMPSVRTSTVESSTMTTTTMASRSTTSIGSSSNQSGTKKPLSKKERKAKKRLERLNRNRKQKCKKVKSALLGFGVYQGGQTDCFKVKPISAGSYRLFTSRDSGQDASVQVTYVRGVKKPVLRQVMFSSDDSSSYSVIVEDKKSSGVWQFNSTFGSITVLKESSCRGRHVRVDYVIMVNVFDTDHLVPAVNSNTRAKRDVGARLKNKLMTRGRYSLLSKVCTGSLKKERLAKKSSRYASGSAQNMVKYYL